jgi:CRP-like cAMP-binding protein
LCELYVRFRAVGLVNGKSFALPVTQAELADATGMSTVHVNRTLQELRGNRLIRSAKRSVTILDWDGLQTAGEFDPTYLHLKPDAEAA